MNIKRADIAVPIRSVGGMRRPAWFENFDLTKVHHGKWKLVSGSVSFSGGIVTLYDAGAASELRSDGAKFLYGALLIYAKLRDTNSIIGFDDGSGNYVRITNDKFEVANGQAGTSDSQAVTIDETAYHNYLIVWNPWGCELWIDGVLTATILTLMPNVELPVRLYAPSGGYCYVNSFHLWQDNPLVGPLGHQFYPKDLNWLIPSLRPREKCYGKNQRPTTKAWTF